MPLRSVLARDPKSKLHPQAFFCTDEAAKSEQPTAWFIRRWQTKVTFIEPCPHLCMETERQRFARPIAPITPVISALDRDVDRQSIGIAVQFDDSPYRMVCERQSNVHHLLVPRSHRREGNCGG